MSDASSDRRQTGRPAGQRGGARADARTSARDADSRAADGVLANLPRTRPQRTSARREDARRARAARKRPAATKGAAEPIEDPAPRQGFEAERDPVSGPVQPPSGVDLLASAAELAGELAQAGLTSGGHLLKDLLARLPRS